MTDAEKLAIELGFSFEHVGPHLWSVEDHVITHALGQGFTLHEGGHDEKAIFWSTSTLPLAILHLLVHVENNACRLELGRIS